jgi:Cu-processing system ATP-binding protein
MIEVSHINKNFGRLKVLKDVNLDCRAGQCIALIGPNGCGKTTLIKSVLGMVIPTSGRISFNGKDIARDFEYRRRIGYMPQIGRYPDNMKIGHLMEMMKEIRNGETAPDEELLQQFRLDQFFSKRMRTLSGGTTQKVSATLAFMFHPEVLILDEPTAGLDPLASEILKEKIIAEKNKGKLILITSHLLSELDDLVTQIIFMQEGEVRFHLPVNELQAQTGEEKISRAIAHVLKRDAR